MKFKNEYRRRFDAVRPDPDLRRRIEERMEAEMRNEKYVKRRAPLRMSRRLAVALAAALILALAATAVAVVQGNALRDKFAEMGDTTIEAQVRDVHVSDADEDFGFTIDEAVWEGDVLAVSCALRVPDDGNTYLCGVYAPTLNGEVLDEHWGSLPANCEGFTDAFVAGGGYPTSFPLLLQLEVDADLKAREDNQFSMKACFLRTEGSVEWDKVAGTGDADYADVDVLRYRSANTSEEGENPLIWFESYEAYRVLQQPELTPEAEEVDGLENFGRPDPQLKELPPEAVVTAGLAEEVCAERELTIPLNLSGTGETIYNDVAEHNFRMDGYSVEITEFRLDHFGLYCKAVIRPDDWQDMDLGDWDDAELEKSNPLYRFYRLLTKDGEELGEASGGMMVGPARDASGDNVVGIEVTDEEYGAIPLNGGEELLFAPETGFDGENFSYALDEAIVLKPIYKPAKPESTEEPDYGAAEGDDLSQ